jgi:TPR repeat protein
MRVPSALPFLAAIAFFAVPVPAQQSLPSSYIEFLTTVDHLQTLTQSDLRKLTSEARSGAPEAQYQLALIYGSDPMKRDMWVAAPDWMLKAAEQGYVPAETAMGKMYLANQVSGPVPDYADADRWLRLAATEGDAEAQFWLGVGYARGYLGGVDYQEYHKWIRKSALQELPDAQHELGQMYEEGNGVPRSNERAAYWFRRAADHSSDVSGVFGSETELVYLYRDGTLKKNEIQAYMWSAVVDASVDPPIDPATDNNIKRVAKHMTNSEIAVAQQRAKDWINRHPRRSKLPAAVNR